VSAFPSGVTIAFLREEVAMDVLHERCAGLDVHQETVVCCVLIGEPVPQGVPDLRHNDGGS
jgi:hypothetical protein